MSKTATTIDSKDNNVSEQTGDIIYRAATAADGGVMWRFVAEAGTFRIV